MQTENRRRWRASAAVQSRARELRRVLTPAEQLLWQHLRADRLGWRFHRQYPVGRFIVDFYCPAARLVIEVDGESHAQQADYDEQRTQWLRETKGLRVLRFTNEQVRCNPAAVVQVIRAAAARPFG